MTGEGEAVKLDADQQAAADIDASIKAGEPVVIRLRSPIKFGSRMVEQLTVRPVKAKYMRLINKAESEAVNFLRMASKLTGEPAEVIDELEGKDVRDVLQAVNGFFWVIQGTGI